jgi:hypothetical protein
VKTTDDWYDVTDSSDGRRDQPGTGERVGDEEIQLDNFSGRFDRREDLDRVVGLFIGKPLWRVRRATREGLLSPESTRGLQLGGMMA